MRHGPCSHLFPSLNCLSCLKQLLALVKMVQLSSLTNEKIKRNEEKREEKIGPPDSSKVNTVKRTTPKLSLGRLEMESGPP